MVLQATDWAGEGEWSWWAIKVWGKKSYPAEHFGSLHELLCASNHPVAPDVGWTLIPLNRLWLKDMLVLMSCDSSRKCFWAGFVSKAKSVSTSTLTLLMSRAWRGDLGHQTSLFSYKSLWGYILENVGSDLSLLDWNWLTSLTDFKLLSKFSKHLHSRCWSCAHKWRRFKSQPLPFLNLGRGAAWACESTSAQIQNNPHHFALNNDEVFYCIYKCPQRPLLKKVQLINMRINNYLISDCWLV